MPILKDVSGVAEDLAARSKKIYSDTVDRLPEGSEPIIGLAVGGIILAAGAFLLGRSLAARKPLVEDVDLEDVKEGAKSVTEPLKEIDFKPLYRLARLWLIARMVV